MHLLQAFAFVCLYTFFVGGIFVLSTTQVFEVRLWSGIWWFALVMMIALVVFTGLAWSFSRHEALWIRLILLGMTVTLVVVSVQLGLEYKPFNPANIKFKLGGLLGGDDSEFGIIQVNDLPPPKSEVSWKDYMPSVLDQGLCQSCWAVSAAGMLSARKNIQDRRKVEGSKFPCIGQHDVKSWHISPQALVDLDTVRRNGTEGKCNPSYINEGLLLARRGVVSSSCVPNFSALGPNCNTSCGSPETITKLYPGGKDTTVCIQPGNLSNTWNQCTEPGAVPTKLKAVNLKQFSGEEIMKREISAKGPIICMLNFYQKRNGAYPAWTLTDKVLFGSPQYNFVSPGFVVRPEMDGTEYTKASTAGNHMIIVFGYGVSGSGVPYWDVRNSWGQWGDQGNIKIERGIDAWNIESYCYSADVV